ncbi:HlyD family efflux transporter periplasmic adaptor subunit [Orbus wheelerorum]|uniref:HlyD family efflux transporter periplasmic adaptor subunit n=1 Tax=Orbus wheelerorum TaxID=3074111 RepID=UPI00370D7368
MKMLKLKKKDNKVDVWDVAEGGSSRSIFIVRIIMLCLICFFVWAYLFKLDEVSSGPGKVVASSKEQIIQSLEGGVLKKLNVKEGQLVDAKQVLAIIDPTRMRSSYGEAMAKLKSARATEARLEAEVDGTPLLFPDDILTDIELVKYETDLYNSRRRSLLQSIDGLQSLQTLIKKELSLTEPLVAKGAASEVEVLRLKRQLTELETRENDTRSQYYVKAREELAKAKTEVESQTEVVLGRQDALTRTTVESPVRGIVKDIEISTIGGVIPPGGKLMEIIPVDERLQIEARISPRDIAYIRDGLPAIVKITAFDYSIYGALNGVVETISPDTIQDEVRKDVYYYRVYIRTDGDALVDKNGNSHLIKPGMIASVDIHTGDKTILDYLLKPFNKAREALRER